MLDISNVLQEVKRLNAWGVEPSAPYLSVYKAIDQYVVPFNAEEKAKGTAKKRGVPVEQVINEWEFSKKWGSAKGLIVHNTIATKFGYQDIKDPKELYDFMSLLDAKQMEEFQSYIKVIDEQIGEFFNKNMHLTPIRSEFWLCDPVYAIRGVADQLMYNERTGLYELYDWKTNKNFRFQPYNKFKPEMFLGSLSYLPKTDSNYYGLQLNLYRDIINRNSKIINISACKIVWFNEHNKQALSIGIPLMQKPIETILQERLKLIENDKRIQDSTGTH